MGVPFYGRKYKVTSTQQNGLRQPGAAAGSGSITYREVVRQNLTANGYVRFWHDGSQVPYLFSPAEDIFISYDDPQPIQAKAEYIRRRQLGGATIWELSQDHQTHLLTVLYDTLQAPAATATASVGV